MKKWLFNPFVYIAGGRALALGGLIMIASAAIVSLNNGHFDGAMDVHFGAKTTLIKSFCETFISWACLVLSLFGLGKIASDSSVRFIDIAGTVALARWPMLLLSFIGFISQPPDINPQKATVEELMKVTMKPSVIIEGLLSLPLIVLFIVLLYNAFSVSTNLKGSKSVWAFIAGLAVAEIASKAILYFAF
jgi:hypothetical protein